MDKSLKLSTSVETNIDWKEGSPISFSGTWEGRSYEDKGFILKIEKERISNIVIEGHFGDRLPPDDFSITYELSRNGEQAILSVTQEGFNDEQSREHSVGNWKGILDSIKNLLEKC